MKRDRDFTWALLVKAVPELLVVQWPGSTTIIAVRSHRIRDHKLTDQTRFHGFAERTYRCEASCALVPWPGGLPRALCPVAAHRIPPLSMETSHHLVRHVTLWDDDLCYREDKGVQILATLRSLAINALRLEKICSITNGIASQAHDIKGLLRLMG